MGLGGVLGACSPPPVLWGLLVTASLAQPAPSSAASFEPLQCEGPASTRDSGCHTGRHLTGSREVDFQAESYVFSRPFHLIVSYDWLILQGPVTPLFEGDPLALRCQAWQDWPLTQVTFYRDGSALGPPGPRRDFSITAVRKADSGHYRCSAVFRSPGPGRPETTSSLVVTVQELFPAPVLRAAPSAQPQEGGPLTLSCQTKLTAQRSAARLLFSFYKDGRVVRSRVPSPELQVPAAAQGHSGSYWCEAVTEDGQVWKHSPKLEVGVQGPSSSVAPPTSNPAPLKSSAPGTSAEKPLGPLPPPPSPPSKGAGLPSPLQTPDPHLYHQMGVLLKQMQDVRALLGHLVLELRDLSSHLKLETRKGPAKRGLRDAISLPSEAALGTGSEVAPRTKRPVPCSQEAFASVTWTGTSGDILREFSEHGPGRPQAGGAGMVFH
ncbi:Fc receptor-like A isoform X2 [Desmodus rotundus]|uniref:Fc receptor-like A isoform X2 n=1 Tax=Desmodus rotundus TaxID=9430 RepID=UPI0023810CF4|nr:Fc receptor-like A isoform X2 [Desmodus rotundus]